MRAPLAALLAVGSIALLGGSTCHVSTSWCSDEHCADGCDCDGGSCCTLGTCCSAATHDEPQAPAAVIVTTDALGEELVWLDAQGRVVRVDAVRIDAVRVGTTRTEPAR